MTFIHEQPSMCWCAVKKQLSHRLVWDELDIRKDCNKGVTYLPSVPFRTVNTPKIPIGLYHSPCFFSHCISFHFLSCIILFCCTVHYCLCRFLIFSLLATSSIYLTISSEHDGSYEASFNSHSDAHVNCVESMRQHTTQLSITVY